MKKPSLIANSTVMILAQVWGMLLTLSITPYVYRTLGSEGYGLFSLVLILATYLTVIDFGFGWGVIKFVAQFAACGDRKSMEGVIRVAIWLTLAIGGAMGFLLAVLSPWLVHSVFNVPAQRTSTVMIGITLGGVLTILMLLSNLLGGVLKGLQRFDLTVGWRSLFLTIQMLGYVVLLRVGLGMLYLWILTAVAMLGCTVAYGMHIRRLLPGISLLPRFDRAYFRTIFSFSAFGFGTRLLTMPYYYLDKLFITSLLPVAALGQYIIPFNLAQRIGGIGGMAVSVLFPSASQHANNHDALCHLYRKTAPIAYSVILPMVLVAVTIGPTFVGHWIDAQFGQLVRLPLILVSIGFGVLTLGSVDGTFIEGIGKPRIRTTIYAALAVVSLPACYALTRWSGIVGTAATVCAAFCLGGVLETICCQVLIMRNGWYARRILGGVFIITAIGLPIGWLAQSLAKNLWSAIAAGVVTYALLAMAAILVFHTRQQSIDYFERTAGWTSRKIRGICHFAWTPDSKA